MFRLTSSYVGVCVYVCMYVYIYIYIYKCLSILSDLYPDVCKSFILIADLFFPL